MSARFSPCGRYRLRLDRHVGAGDTVAAVFGVNPSMAGAENNDQTVRKWIGFGERLGWRRLIVANAFGMVATDVRELAKAEDPLGPEYDRSVSEVIGEADILIACWGHRAKLPKALRPRLDQMRDLLERSGKPLFCWGLTASGDPIHPMMLGYATPLIRFGGNDGR